MLDISSGIPLVAAKAGLCADDVCYVRMFLTAYFVLH
jgi:hypothetical protein